MGALRDSLLAVAVLAVLLGSLYAYAGGWPPAVIVESGSMMHPDEDVPFGRYGTIDPGDLVIVRSVRGVDDVDTWAESERGRYGDEGDVIVFDRGHVLDRTPIIHRAVAWVTVDESAAGARYVVPWNPGESCPNTGAPPADGRHCTWGEEGITVAELGLAAYRPERSGFITKGDNPVSNPRPDQQSGIAQIVTPERVIGKARGEVPWIGLVKLALAREQNEAAPPESWWRVGSAYAPVDLWVMLGVSVTGVLVGPVAFDAWRERREAAG